MGNLPTYRRYAIPSKAGDAIGLTVSAKTHQILMLPTPEQQQFIDTHFGEGARYSRANFEQLTTSAELHYLLTHHNWDDDNRVLQWMAESSLCSRATALEMFWLAQPRDFQAYPLGKKLKNRADAENFHLLQTLLTRYPQGFYAESDRHFDPSPHFAQPVAIPASLYLPSAGEEPYLYWDAEEINCKPGGEFVSAVQRCDRMDLYNFAVLLDDRQLLESHALLLAHPLCDRGIAQLLFWRLQTRWPISGDHLFRRDFIRDWQADRWPQAHIAYHPPAPSSPEPAKPAWLIPDIFYQPV